MYSQTYICTDVYERCKVKLNSYRTTDTGIISTQGSDKFVKCSSFVKFSKHIHTV